MLNGIDPIIIFQFYKKTPAVTSALSKIPILGEYASKLALPPIPIYLSEKLTGIFIDAESKNIDVGTSVDTSGDGDGPLISQKGIGSIVKIDMIANKNSIGLTLLSAMSDVIFSKVTSQEYSITYLHGATTIFNGLLHSLSISQETNSELMNITMELSRSGEASATSPQPTSAAGDVSLAEGGQITGGTLPSGQSFTTPAAGQAIQAVP